MRAFLLLFILLITVKAEAISSLGIYVIPAAVPLKWESSLSLIRSFQRSLAKASLKNGLYDAPRKAIGHVVMKIDCGSGETWTSISIDPVWMTPLILKNGIDGMFAESAHGYMQSEDEIKHFLSQNSESAISMRLQLEDETCRKMMVFDKSLRAQKPIWFGPLINTRERSGGTGSTYAAALVKLGNFQLHPDQWVETVRIPGSNKEVTFYSVQSMWDFAQNERSSFPSRAYVEEIKIQNTKIQMKGVSL